MCGRFYTNIEKEEMQKIIDAVNRAIIDRETKEKMHTGEIRPTDITPIYVNSPSGATPTLMKWGFPGFIPRDSKAKVAPPIINARSETIMEKPSFSRFVNQRCLVPANSYFEWANTGAKKKPKFEFHPVDDELDTFWMAAIYRSTDSDPVPVFTIITMDASDSVSPIHDRMPVILGSKLARRAWMQGEKDILGLFRETAVRDIAYKPCGEQQLRLV